MFGRLQKLEESTQLELAREMLGVKSESASGLFNHLEQTTVTNQIP
jgi:hypothetical protein